MSNLQNYLFTKKRTNTYVIESAPTADIDVVELASIDLKSPIQMPTNCSPFHSVV